LSVLAALIAGFSLPVEAAQAAELHAAVTISIREAIAEMATVFEKRTDHKVETTVAAPGEIVATLQAGRQADVVVVTDGALAELEDKCLVRRGGVPLGGGRGRDVGGRGSCQNRGSSPCRASANRLCTTARDAVPTVAGPAGRAGSRRWRTAAVACMADYRRGRRRVTGTPLSMAYTAPRRLPGDARSESLFAPCALWCAKSRSDRLTEAPVQESKSL
jgi:hypothetical protein